MSDLSEFHELSKPRRSPCGVLALKAQMDAKQQQTFEEAMADDSITLPAIKTVLERWGVTGATDAKIKRHRKGDCSCAK